MKKLIFVLSFLISVAYAQNINIAKADIDRVFNLPINVTLFENSVFSSKDTLLKKPDSAIYSRLTKFGGAALSISIVNGKYRGRIFKNNVYYYELKYTNSTTYTFVKKDAKDIESELPISNIEDNNITLENIKKTNQAYSSIPTDDQMALVTEYGWGCILLDFDGAYVSSSMWNYGTPFTCAAVSFVNNADSINYVVNRVTQMYYPFSVVVTTSEAVYQATQVDKRIRTIITPTSAWYPGVLGISYVTSFTWGDDTPNFVFWQNGRITSLTYLAFAAAHEDGHTFGLYHQSNYNTTTCAFISQYNTGFGTGDFSWCPVMGNNTSNRNACTLNYGPTPNGCTFKQDNINIILTSNNLPNDGWRDPSTIPKNSFLFSDARGQGAGEKSILQPNYLPVSNDSATFQIVVYKTGTTTITAAPLGDGTGNNHVLMRMKSRLYNANNVLVAESNDANVTTLNAVISQTIAPGTYYLTVSKGIIPASIAPVFFNPAGYGQYGWFYVTQN